MNALSQPATRVRVADPCLPEGVYCIMDFRMIQLCVTVASYHTFTCTLQVPAGAYMYLLLQYFMHIILRTFTFLAIAFGDLTNQEPTINNEIQICLTF